MAAQLGVDPAINLGPLLECKDPEEINRLILGKCLTKHKTGLRLLLAPHNLEEPRDITAEQSESIIQELAGIAEYTLVDLPFHPSTATKTALQHCNFVVLMLELEVPAWPRQIDATAAPILGNNREFGRRRDCKTCGSHQFHKSQPDSIGSKL